MLDQKEIFILEENYDRITIKEVWKKGNIIFDVNPAIIRRDSFGDWIKKDDYGNSHSAYGWTIEQVVPTSKGGNGEIENLRPLHWKNSRTVL